MNNNLQESKNEKKGEEQSLGFLKSLYELVEVFAVTVSVIILVFTFVIRIAYVKGDSMNYTLEDGNALAVSNLFYTPKHGDIIVFQAPDSRIEGGVVKRVIATEGQEVDIDFATWTVYVDGEPLVEPYVNYMEGYYMLDYHNTVFPLTVPEGHIFVMGDNRNESNDSRNADVGCVDTRYVFGKVLFRVTPFSKFGGID